MLPVQTEFPKFVPDQLLTSEDLNNVFGYLDEQNRITRTNLVGIGIVCGLQLQVNNAQSTVTITKGCGVTSQGYLIAVETTGYTLFRKYDVETPRAYEKFKKTVGSAVIPIDVWELREAGSTETDTAPIDAAFLKDKAILLFVELKEENNKNCDPDSCDDKGVSVTVSFLPMAVTTADAQLLMGTTAANFGLNTHSALPDMKMKRWDVPNTAPVYSSDIFAAYLKLLDKNFIDAVENNLKNVYAVFGNIVAPGVTANPFNGLSQKFSFLYDNTIGLNKIVNLQYYYDFFSDLMLAYDEFRKTGTELLSICCPDGDWFPRHLLLGEAVASVQSGTLPLRHHFIYSPLFGRQNLVNELQSLFERMVLMISNFFVPASQVSQNKEDENIRITPSMLWNVPLSSKAIPFYYQVNNGAKPLYLKWNYNKTLLNDANKNLSYHAALYNNQDDWVRAPLKYDLEPYNFLRIEGITGKSYRHVLSQVKAKISQNRLPVDIIALNTETSTSRNFVAAVAGLSRTDAGKEGLEMICYFQDLESVYDSMRSEILCMLCKELKYYYDFTFAIVNAFLGKQTFAGQPTRVEFLNECSPGYIIKERSLGNIIELLFRKGLTDRTLTLETFFQAIGINVQDNNNDDIPDNLTGQASAVYLTLLNFFKIPLGIIRIADLLTEDLSEFDVNAYCTAASLLSEYARGVKVIFGFLTVSSTTNQNIVAVNRVEATTNTIDKKAATDTSNATATPVTAVSALAASENPTIKLLASILMIEDLLDHLDVLIYNCKCAALKSLKEDYMKRYALLTQLRQFGYFTKMHPGIQHKAGVPVGGTFIIVYHNRKRSRLRQESTVKDESRKFKDDDSRVSEKMNARNERTFITKKDFFERETRVLGIVIDEEDKPVSGATVSILETGEQALTDLKGIFRLVSTVIPYTILVEAVGFEDQEIVSAGERKIIVTLKPSRGSILDQLPEGTVIADFYLPYRCCSDCPPIQYVVTDPVEPQPVPNQGPKADAGADQQITLPEDKVRLDGSASTDPDGVITFFQWAKLQGPGNPQFVTASSAQTDVVDLEEGDYIFELTATDDKGALARDTVNVRVNPAPPPENKPPVANAGPDNQIVLTPNTLVILDGSLSKDEDGTIVAFSWKQIRGANAVIQTPSLVQTPVTGLQPGEYEFELTVKDNQGASGTDTVVINVVRPENKPPVADAGKDQNIQISATVLDGSASNDPEGGVLNFDWSVASGPNTPNINNNTNAVTNVSGLISGVYQFALKVIDDKGASAIDTVSVNVKISQPQKVCGPLPGITQNFRDLDGKLPADFKRLFEFYDELQSYFKTLQEIQSRPIAEQIDFFANGFNQQQTQQLIIKWLERLQNAFILERKDFRLPALQLYRILLALSMYIVCIQPEDFNKAKVPMDGVFKVIGSHVEQWIRNISNFSAAEIALVKLIGGDIGLEINRVISNGEEANKPGYLKVVKKINEMIQSIP